MAAPQLYYKAVRENGFDLQTNTVDYARVCGTGEVIRHPTSTAIVPKLHSTYLSISGTPGDTLGNSVLFPRLFLVRPVGEVRHFADYTHASPYWYGVLALEVVEERPGLEVFGDNGEAFLGWFFDKFMNLTNEDLQLLADVHTQLPEGMGKQIEVATFHSGVFRAATLARLWVGVIVKAKTTRMSESRQKVAMVALISTAWGIITRDLIPAEYTALLMRTWCKTFGADYA